MPQASNTHRALMKKWFGSETGDDGPMQFLESRGYCLRPDGLIDLPTPAHTASREEYVCVLFLINEWDWDAVWHSDTEYAI